MRIAIHQPNYLPWLGWFAKAAQVDLLVLLDDVPLSDSGWTKRCRIGLPGGGSRLLTVPVVGGGSGRRINECVLADPDRWPGEHHRRLEAVYGRLPGWSTIEPFIEGISSGATCLVDVNERLLVTLCRALGVETPLVRASTLRDVVRPKSEGLADICDAVGASVYVSGTGAATYNDIDGFRRRAVDLQYVRFTHPEYPQPWSQVFEPGLSAVDLLACRPDAAAATLCQAISR